jgi:hypothetical protein
MSEPIMPTTEDINAVLNSNPTAQMQLQIQMLSRVLQEKDAENGTGSTEKLEKVS